MSETVYRSAGTLVCRDDGDQGPILEGRMVPYGEWTEINSIFEGHFLERFAPGSLAKTIKERAQRIRALFEHGMGSLDRQPIAEIEEMRDEGDGAYYRASLLEGLPDLFLSGLRRGLYGASVGGSYVKLDRNKKPGESEHNPDGIEERTVKEFSLREFSIVSFPAYEGASARTRSLTDEFLTGRMLKDPERLIQVIREVTEQPNDDEPPHSEPAPETEGEEAPETEQESRRTPNHDYLADEEGDETWRL